MDCPLWHGSTPMEVFIEHELRAERFLVQGNGIRVRDESGRWYIDARSSCWNLGLGYSAETVKKQSGSSSINFLMPTFSRMTARRKYRNLVLAFDGSYHGLGIGACSLSGITARIDFCGPFAPGGTRHRDYLRAADGQREQFADPRGRTGGIERQVSRASQQHSQLGDHQFGGPVGIYGHHIV